MASENTTLIYGSVLAVTLALATVALALRLWVRSRLTRNLGVADYMLAFGHCANIAGTGLWIDTRVKAMGYEPDTEEYYHALSIPFMIVIICFTCAAALTKAAIGMWFLNMAHLRWHRVVIFTPLACFGLATLVVYFLLLFRCGLPISIYRVLNSGDCHQFPSLVQGIGITYASLNTMCDVAFATVPIHMLYRAKSMTLRHKLLGGLLISSAVIGTIFSIVRLPSLEDASVGPTLLSSGATAKTVFFSLLETAVGILTISAVTLRPLLKIVKERWPCSSTGSTGEPLPCQEKAAPASVLPLSVTVCVRTKSDSFRIDTRALKGIGLLPDTSFDDEGDVLDDETVVGSAHSTAYSSISTQRLGSYPLHSIEEVLHTASGWDTSCSGISRTEADTEV